MRYVRLHNGKKLAFAPETPDDVIIGTVRNMIAAETEKEAKPQRDQQQLITSSLLPLIEAINMLTATINQRTAEIMQVMAMPKRLVRDSEGRAIGAEITPQMTMQ